MGIDETELSDIGAKPQRPRPRIESLSDLLFGLALSVGAITLVSSPPTTNSAVVTDIASFGFDFFILISIWMNYTEILSVLPLESRKTIRLNVMLLFAVSIEPFLFNLVRNPPVDTQSYWNLTSTLYSIDLGALMLILGSFTLVLADEDKKLVPVDELRKFRRESTDYLASGLVFLATALPLFDSLSFLGEPVRVELWFVPIVLARARRGHALMDEKRSVEAIGQPA